MNPSVDERLASIVRSLTEVILPHLPPEASLAQEQAHLAIGHIQILQAQLDAAPAFEREELVDAIAIATALVGAVHGGPATTGAVQSLAGSIANVDIGEPRALLRTINEAVEKLVMATAADGAMAGVAALNRIILDHEYARAQKDRKWFAPFGFDSL